MMKKNKWMYFLIMPVLLLMGFILSSCCSAKVCEVKVTLIGVDEDLDLESYSYTVQFNESTTISLDIPEGYDILVNSNLSKYI